MFIATMSHMSLGSSKQVRLIGSEIVRMFIRGARVLCTNIPTQLCVFLLNLGNIVLEISYLLYKKC